MSCCEVWRSWLKWEPSCYNAMECPSVLQFYVFPSIYAYILWCRTSKFGEGFVFNWCVANGNTPLPHVPNFVIGQTVRALLRKMPKNLTLVSRLWRSLKVVGTDTYRPATYDFLLTSQSNHGPISYCFRDKWRFQSKIINFPPLLFCALLKEFLLDRYRRLG